MGRSSTKENKNIFQIAREKADLTRDEASELMDGIPSSRIEKIEYETVSPTPYDILQMAHCYKVPELCNHFCSSHCEIGRKYVPKIKTSELPSIILKTLASLNEVEDLSDRLIQISCDGVISDDEIKDFALISYKLDQIVNAANSLNLWVERTASQNKINKNLLDAEKEKLYRQ